MVDIGEDWAKEKVWQRKRFGKEEFWANEKVWQRIEFE